MGGRQYRSAVGDESVTDSDRQPLRPQQQVKTSTRNEIALCLSLYAEPPCLIFLTLAESKDF